MEKERVPAGLKKEPEGKPEREKEAEKKPQKALEELKEASSLAELPELMEFISEHPQVLELPQEVIEAIKGGKSLSRAWAEYENSRLREELAASKQNLRNEERAPGSARGDAEGESELDELMAIFDSVFK